MSNKIQLTYILTTRNKLSYLKYTLVQLLKNKHSDEEIIVIDGNSTDGTVEYLQSIISSTPNSIDTFISEEDKGEAHGYNKGLLVANGELIKFISDDDVFCYRAIQLTKNHMLQNKYIDIVFGITYNVKKGDLNSLVCQKEVELKYAQYLKSNKPFSFTGLSMMIRQSSLSKIGLFSTGTIAPDTDFSLRVTSLKANIEYSFLPIVVRVENMSSNFNINTRDKFAIEGLKLYLFYGMINYIEFSSKMIFIKIKKIIAHFFNYFNRNNNLKIDAGEVLNYDFYGKVSFFLEKEYEKTDHR